MKLHSDNKLFEIFSWNFAKQKKNFNVKCVNGRNKTLHIKISRVNTENEYKKLLMQC